VEQRAVVLAAVEAVAEADTIWPARHHDPHRAAEAAAGDPVHGT
jgi:hypothetical protein